MYLGLPSLVGRLKKRVFGFIKDRLWKRLQGWRAKKISRAGKTVLIKNVATAVPSYCMSSFLLPRSMCKEMEVMLNNYWWQSSTSDRRSINWVVWDGLSMSKCQAKYVWTFINKPQSLVSRFFKAKYFPNLHVLQAKLGVGSSFIWKGIVTARNKIMHGYRWVLEDGEIIKCCQEPWLIAKADFRVDQTHNYVDINIRVVDLFVPGSKDWDVSIVGSTFSANDAALILSTVFLEFPVLIA
ncbi:putative mitochondrial protein AtMg00310 [Apium graveolens]|uniref:putative mitochondrial protein AtMg00310 n=1 Tax=Apium graveolens TaxID=4045 RepID=UPI003D7BE58A